MEAPEKIWMNDDWVHQFDDKDFMGEDSVEYTRSDAFIEKACEWLYQRQAVDLEVADIERFISEFKQAMGGDNDKKRINQLS